MNELERLRDRVRDLSYAHEKEKTRADKAEGEAASLRWQSADLQAKVKGFEDARASSAIPEPGPTERELGYEAGLERAIARIRAIDLPSPFEARCVEALTEDLDTAECDAKPIGGKPSKEAVTDTSAGDGPPDSGLLLTAENMATVLHDNDWGRHAMVDFLLSKLREAAGYAASVRAAATPARCMGDCNEPFWGRWRSKVQP